MTRGHVTFHAPAIGDVYEYQHGSVKGKRIRLIAKPDSNQFDTVTISHPTSERAVGRTSWVARRRLGTSVFRYIPEEDR